MSSLESLLGDIIRVSSMHRLLGDMNESSLSDERDDTERVSVHEDHTGDSEEKPAIQRDSEPQLHNLFLQ